MRSDTIKSGFDRSPHRSLLKATGVIQSDEEIAARMIQLPPFTEKIKNRYLARCASMVASADTGAVLQLP